MKIAAAPLRAFLAASALWASLAGVATAQDDYTLFESGPVRPLALSPDGSTLFACNVPDARLEIFAVTPSGLRHSGSVPVGLEPVAVAARTNGEVWVVNHVSDSVSIVDVAARRVVRTLLVGDEPRDIVFAGPGKNRAFITAAHRGQNRPGDPALLTPGVGRSDVWVFDATSLGAALGGTPLAILNLFGDTPRALAVTPAGGTVYAAVFHSGNKTTAVTAGVLPTPPPAFTINTTDPVSGQPLSVPTPAVGVMLRHVSGNTWEDVTGADHTNLVRFRLPDYDVFAIDANATPPVQTQSFPGVGTILYNMAVNPVSGAVYVSNTDANNFDRFEGFGTPNLRGELHKARVSILSGGAVTARHLNTHIDYSVVSPPQSINDRSLGLPTALAVSSDGATLYLAAFGSRKVAFLPTAQLTAGTYVPSTADHVELTGGGPSGVALDEANGRMYVYTRFDDGISTVDLASRTETAHLRVHNPEPQFIVEGRPFLYDTRFSSSNGEASCAVCHVFGDFDSLTWDLGDPDAPLLFNNNPFVNITGQNFGIASPPIPSNGATINIDFHPLKGPMNTQTLRGMEHHGPMHWRGDRSGGGFSNRSPNWDGDPNALDENQGFLKFNPAFIGLLGRQNQLAGSEMQQFADFILALQQPPNPIRDFEQVLTPSQAAGEAFYNGPISDTLKNCNGCHTLDQAQGFFGTGGLSTFEGETQHFKVAHLRNIYQKVGMFGNPAVGGDPATGDPNAPQIRGFGYLHDGTVETVVRFLNAGVFQFPDGDPQRTDVANFIFAFPSDVAPVVGQQLTLTSTNDDDPAVIERLDVLVARAGTPYADPDPPPKNECDLVVKGMVAGEPRGWWMSAPGVFTPDVDGAPTISDADLRLVAATPGQDLTYTCMPPGSGARAGVDRGGVGDGSAPDGIRDASQCGDVTRDGVATGPDVGELRAWLAGGAAPAGLAKCNVNGANGSSPAECDVADVSALRRGIAGLSASLTQGCTL